MNRRGKNPNSLKALAEHRNLNGQRNAEAVRFSRELRSALIAGAERLVPDRKGVERPAYDVMIDEIWHLAARGVPWAVEFIAERLFGKVPQSFSGSVTVDDVSKLTDEERSKRIAELLELRSRSGITPAP